MSELAADGSSLIYSTYLGGNNFDYGQGIAVDSNGNAYVTGYTKSTNFPTKLTYSISYYQSSFVGGNLDAFVSELAAGGSSLIYSTYLGGGSQDFGQGIAADSSGNAYVAGSTDSGGAVELRLIDNSLLH